MVIIFNIKYKDDFTIAWYKYGSFYRVVMLEKMTDEDIKLPACYREFKDIDEAEECFNEWTSL